MRIEKLIFLTGIIVLAVFSRLIPHPPNFTSLIAVALFSGVYLDNKTLAISIPIITMFLSDLIIGFHDLITFVYLSFVIIVLLGFAISKKKTIRNIITANITAAFIFYLLTNLGVWYSGSLYPKSLDGLYLSYFAALPFLTNSILSSLFYSMIIFGGFELASINISILKEIKIEQLD